MAVKPAQGCTTSVYRPRDPAETILYRVVQGHFETYLSLSSEGWDDNPVPAYVEREFRRYLGCGHDFLVAFSCKGRGVCPSCNARRMAETAAHLVERLLSMRCGAHPPVTSGRCCWLACMSQRRWCARSARLICVSSPALPRAIRCAILWHTSARVPIPRESRPPAPALRNPASLVYQPKPSMAWAFAARSQLTPRCGKVKSNRYRCTTRLPSPSPTSHSIRRRMGEPYPCHPFTRISLEQVACLSCAQPPFKLPSSGFLRPRWRQSARFQPFIGIQSASRSRS